MGRMIGTVAALTRFPVKSMAGEPLEVADIDWQGIEGDRQYAFVQAGNATRFPWFTGRQHPEMVLHRARFADPADPRTAPVEVTAPDGWQGLLGEMPDRLAAAGNPVSLIQLGIGAYDAMPVSIASTAGHAEVEAAHGGALDPRRFRINVVVQSDEPERDWLGKRLAFGDEGAELQVACPIDRCVMITIDPDTGVRDPSIQRTVAQGFGNQYGVYASPARKGLVRIGDTVRVIG